MQVSRTSTSSGLIFLNGCLIHSHSRSQTSVSLSSMEAEILAATSLLTEAIYVKQVLGSQRCVEMRLRLDSTSAQAFFTRLGPGRAKHLSTRLLWTQQAMRRQWFAVDRISTKENPADLNTKALSRERRAFLMKRIGLVCEQFGEEEEEVVPYQGKKRQLVKMLLNMIMATNLTGFDGETFSSTNATSSDNTCRPTRICLHMAILVIIVMTVVSIRMFFKATDKMEQIEIYKNTLGQTRTVCVLQPQEKIEEMGRERRSHRRSCLQHRIAESS